MEEKFLHYTWKYKLFNQLELFTVKGEKIEVLHPGEHNHQSGPDFFNALIRINGTLWAGNLEIHVRSSDWNAHRHQEDKAYDNIILHVVYEHNQDILNSKKETIPTLELKNLIPAENFSRYSLLRNSKEEIACGREAGKVPAIILETWYERLMAERLEAKTGSIQEIMRETKNDLEESFYRSLAKNFGFKTNALPFYLLAKNLPLKILLRHADNPLQTEALLFGQAGLLEGFFEEKYPQQLQNEYEFLRTKYTLVSLDKTLWKTGGMRPQNFPAVRIAQFASLIKKLGGLFHRLKEEPTLKELDKLLGVEPSAYWKDHYSLGIPSPPRSKKLGFDGLQNIAINTIAPFLFLYGKIAADDSYTAKAMKLLQELQAENNAVVRRFAAPGLKAQNALQSQALLQLKMNYCDRKKCLDCRIGYTVLNNLK